MQKNSVFSHKMHFICVWGVGELNMYKKDISPVFSNGVNFKLYPIKLTHIHGKALSTIFKWTLRNKHTQYFDDN